MSRIMMQARGVARPLSFGGRVDREPLQCSARSAWLGVPFEVHRMGSSTDVGESGPLDGEVGLMIVTRGSYEVAVRGPRGDIRSRSRRGTVHVLSGAERPHVLEIRGDAEVVAFHLYPEWLEYLPFSPSELRRFGPLSGGRTALSLVAAARAEVATGCGAGRLFAESLSLSLLSYTAHLLPRSAHAAETLSPAEREMVRCYVHDNLDRNLSVAMLAQLVDSPPRQFSARFREAFGTTPHSYVTKARLRQGARLLESGKHEIAEVALRVGFCSQSHFTSAFRRAYGETPRRYLRARRSPAPS
jgi:AraC family transcriptional regulator